MKQEHQIKLLSSLPDYPGMVARDCYKLMKYKQPLYAIQSGLILASVLRSNSRLGYYKARTNLFTMGISGTATGKNSGLSYVGELLDKAGVSEIKSHAPGSKLAFTTALNMGCCSAVMLWDEIGKDLDSILAEGRSGSPYMKEIGGEMLKIFSSANQSYMPPLVSDSPGSRGNFRFHQPILCIHGMGTAETLFNSVTSKSVSDGLLPRFIYFKGEEKPEKILCNEDPAISDKVIKYTSYLSDRLWLKGDVYRDEYNGLTVVGITDSPKYMPFSNEAWQFFQDMESMFDSSYDETERRIRSRMVEHTVKVALAIEGDRSEQISLTSLQWAAAFINETTKDFINDVRDYLSDTPYEKDCNKIMRFLNDRCSATTEELYSAFPMPTTALEARLDTLYKSNRISKNKIGEIESREKGEIWNKYASKMKQKPFRG